jgi:hypothetical protein
MAKLTPEKLIKLVKEIIENTDSISIYRYCKTNGSVITTPSNLNLCNESNCKNCTTIKNKIDESNKKTNHD